MPYQRNTWARGDTITSALLNHIEQGISDLSDVAETIGDLHNVVAGHTNALGMLEAAAQENPGGGNCTNIKDGEGTGAVIEGLLEDYTPSGYSYTIEKNSATGDYAHAEGCSTTASGENSHAEGYSAVASGTYSHAEGTQCEASGEGSHAEGANTVASGSGAHAEGFSGDATGMYSHAEGFSTLASGGGSHAEGSQCIAEGSYSHAEGYQTHAKFAEQHVFGMYNEIDPKDTDSRHKGNYVEIVGNGSTIGRSNARTLDWEGNERLAGNLTLGMGTVDEVTITPAQYKTIKDSAAGYNTAITQISDTVSELQSGVAGNRAAIAQISGAIDGLEHGSLSASGAQAGQVPVADGAGSWAWGSHAAGTADVEALKPSNLYHREDSINGYWINTNTGVPFEAPGYFASGFMPVTPGKTYKVLSNPLGTYDTFRIYRYDAGKNYIDNQAQGTYTAQSGDAYIRVAVGNDMIDSLIVRETSKMFDSYETDEYYELSDKVAVKAGSLDKTVFKTGNNLFNSDTIMVGYRLRTDSYDLAWNADYYTSAPIEVEPFETYYIGPFAAYTIVFYAANGNIVDSLSDTVGTFTVPATAKTLRFSQTFSATDNAVSRMMVSKSSGQIKNEDYYIYGANPRRYNRYYNLSDAVWHWANNEKFPIGFLGDSTTDGAGTSVWTSSNRHEAVDTASTGFGSVDYVNTKAYPYLLEQLIRDELGVTNARVYNIGYTGTYYDWAIPKYDEIFGGVYADVKMVGLVYGINDRTVNTTPYDFYQTYRNNTIYTIHYLRDRGIQPFFVTTQAIIAPYTRSTFPDMSMRTAYHAVIIANRVMKELAEEFNMEIIDMNEFGDYILRESNYGWNEIIPDELHFSDLGNRLEAEFLFSKIYGRCIDVHKKRLLTYTDQLVRSEIYEDILGNYSGDKHFKLKVSASRSETTDKLLMDFWINNLSGEELTLKAYCSNASTQYVIVDGVTTSITQTEQTIGQLDCGVHHITAMSGSMNRLDWTGFELS